MRYVCHPVIYGYPSDLILSEVGLVELFAKSQKICCAVDVDLFPLVMETENVGSTVC